MGGTTNQIITSDAILSPNATQNELLARALAFAWGGQQHAFSSVLITGLNFCFSLEYDPMRKKNTSCPIWGIEEQLDQPQTTLHHRK